MSAAQGKTFLNGEFRRHAGDDLARSEKTGGIRHPALLSEPCTCVGEREVRMTVDNRGKVHEQCRRCGKRIKQPERIEFDYERVTA